MLGLVSTYRVIQSKLLQVRRRRRMMKRLLLFFFFFMARIQFIFSYTHPEDLAILQALKVDWQSKPPTWTQSNDPCGSKWEGVTCSDDSRVTALGLSSMGIIGKLPSDIGGLSQLTSLDLSFNTNLTGSIPSQLGNLENLRTLILAGCGLTGSIPDELGNLTQLTFLALNSNKLSGIIPASLGKLSNLDWLDVADNELTGSLPVSNDTSPGLDMLLVTKHFHFNMNNLSGSIPEELFSSEMNLIHVLFDGNQLTGPIPSTLGLVQDLEALRIDRNMLTGEIPSNINNLTNLNELNLANNGLHGSIPDLSNMNLLNYVDLSNNSFNASEAPEWFSSLPALNTLVLENGSLHGVIPSALFSSSLIQQLLLKNNAFSGTLNISVVGPNLQLIDLENNQIGSLTLGSAYNEELILHGNPVCDNNANNLGTFCQVQQTANNEPYKTNTSQCATKTCSGFMKLSPANCECQVPYQGILKFRAPFFRDLNNAELFDQLGDNLSSNLSLPYHSAYLENPFFDSSNYMQIKLSLFPSSGTYFSHSDISRIGTILSNNIFKPPELFGPYFFIGFEYPFKEKKGVFLSTGVVVGIAVSATVLLLGLIALGVYAIRQKKRAEHAVELSKPFASWGGGGKDIAGAPQLKGARWFSFDEVRKCTHNFSEHNEIGSGGYGKVYKGVLSDGQVVAIKRAQQGSMQGGQEFRTEIELLSRVHHKNLVSLVGFCFEQGEQMLVYEFISNGTLRENLKGRSGIYLDWKTRLQITLGSARGLAYLHELANPPIIHRDIKTMNILLDENLTAKVADFGLSKLLSGTEAHVSTQVKGTLGYLDPEYYMTQQLTEKSDVYSFGVVMLELITSRLPIEKGKYIVREVRLALDKNNDQYSGLREMIDPSLTKNGGNLIGFSKFLELAMRSVQESAADRPSMNEILKEIELILHEDDVNNADMISAASSGTDFGTSNQHPYDDVLAKGVAIGYSSNSFDYSGGYNLSAKIEPK